MVDKGIFRELKLKVAEQRREAMIAELTKKLERCNRALESSSRLILQYLESEREHQIMEAGYSEGE